MANRVEIELSYRDTGAEAGLKQTTAEMTRMEQATGMATSTLSKLAAGFGAMWLAMKVVEFARFAQDIAVMAGNAEKAGNAFRYLAEGAGINATASLEKLREVTGGEISDLKLMQDVGKALSAGLNFDQAVKAMQFLKKYSESFGTDFEETINKLFLGLESGQVRFLKQVGINISTSDAMFAGLNEYQKRIKLTSELIKMMEDRQGALPHVVNNASDATDRAAASWENYKVVLGKAFEGTSQWVALNLARSLDESAAAMKRASGAQGSWWDKMRAQGMPSSGFQSTPTTNVTGIRGHGAFTPSAFSPAPISASMITGDVMEGLTGFTEMADRIKKLKEEFLSLGGVIEKTNDVADLFPGRTMSAEALAAVTQKLKEQSDELQKYRDLLHSFAFMQDNTKSLLAGATTPGPRGGASAFWSAQNKADIAGQIKDLDLWREKGVGAGQSILDAMREVEAHRIQHILLFFDANTANVTDASDMAAYSIGLLTERLRGLSPALSDTIGGIQQIVVGMNAKKTDTMGNVIGGISAGGWAGIVTGGLGIITTALDLFGKRAERNYQEWVKLQAAINAASEAGGRFAQALAGESLASLKQQYEAAISSIRGQGLKGPMMGDLANFGQVVIGTENVGTKAELAANEINRLSEAIARFGGVPDTFQNAMFEFNHLVRMGDIQDPAAKLKLLNDEIGKLSGFDLASLNIQDLYAYQETIADLNRQIADVDIKTRQDAAQKVIDSIHAQADEVKKALDDAAAVQQQAMLRAVGIQFDVQEMALRRSFASRISGASTDPAEMARLVLEIGREIDTLRLGEQAAGTAELAKVRASIEAQKDLAQQSSDLLVQAVTNAAQQTGVDFTTAVKQQTDSLLAGFADSLTSSLANTVLDPNNALDPHSIVNTNLPITPAELVALQNRIMIDMASVLNPVGVRPIELSAALQMQGIKDVDVQRALELQGLKFVNMESWFGLQNVKMVDLAQSLGLSGKQTVDLSDALRTQGTLNIQMPTALSTTGTKDVALSTALLLSGTKNASVTDVFTLTGGKSVDLATYLTLTGGKDVGLATALTLTGSKSVDLATALTTTGGTGIGDALTVLHTDNTLIAMWLAYIQTNTLRTADLVEGSWRWTAAKDTGTLTSAFVMGVGGTMMTRGAFQFPSFDVGGTVPGPAGAPMLAVVHGGETFSGVGGQLGGGLTVQAAPQGSPSVNINISTVNAYGTQSADDIRALYRATIEPEIVKSLTDGVLSKVIPR